MSLNPRRICYADFDFAFIPFTRSTVGFDRLFAALDKQIGLEANAPSYPPYNIERVSDNEYRISIAVAGFGEDELTVETRENVLTVRGAKKAPEPVSQDKRGKRSIKASRLLPRVRAPFQPRRLCRRDWSLERKRAAAH